MNTNTPSSGADGPRADADLVIACVDTKRLVPPEVAKRVQERTAKARARILADQGVKDIGVQIIREFRGELPDA